MIEKFFQLFSFSCRHHNISKPFAAAAPARVNKSGSWDPVEPAASHYVVCLDCGQKFQYDWQNMRVIRKRA